MMDPLDHMHHLTPTPFRLFSLTVVLLGLQLAWAVELAYGTPYLLSLGMDKAWTSLVWLAGPLSGLLVQPIVGALSDTCTLRLGRRRPFLLLGTAASLVSMTLVALSRPLGGSDHHTVTTCTIAIAVVGFYLLDFAVNTVQAASRALIVDVMHPRDQALANAVAGAMVCLGNVLGYAAGLVDWPHALGIAATPAAQFQLVCSVASVALVCAVAVTVTSTPELPNAVPATAAPAHKRGLVHTFVGPLVTVAKAIPNMPRIAVHVCIIQVCCWLGWFPFLFYSTTWVAQYTTNSHFPFDGADAARATRQGALAFFSFSLVALVVATVLPSCTRRFNLPLARVWMAGEALFAVTLALGTLAVGTGPRGASLVITLTGIAWAIGMWVPMALLGQVVSQATAVAAATGGYRRVPLVRAVSALPHVDGGTKSLPGQHAAVRKTTMHGHASSWVGLGDSDSTPASSSAATLVDQAAVGRVRPQSVSPSRATRAAAAVPAAGIVLGLHNVAIVLPQLVVSVVAAGLFAVLPDGRGKPMVPGAADDAIGWLFRLGGAAAAVAVVLIWRLLGRAGDGEDVEHQEEAVDGDD